MTRKTMQTKREAFGDDEAARELAQNIASLHEDPPHAPNGDPQEEPEDDDTLESADGLKSFDDPTTPTKETPEPEEEHDDEQEPDGRWVRSEAGCWVYE